jgi:predicted  nucleic acid-binding Zn-ribbon protein
MAENRNEKQSVPDLNEQLDKLKMQKTAIEKRLIQVKDKIKNFENIKYNLENSENNLTDKSAQKEHTTQHHTPNYRLR